MKTQTAVEWYYDQLSKQSGKTMTNFEIAEKYSKYLLEQQKKLYSEEEVRQFCMNAYNQAIKDGDKAWLGTFDEWFEQFKKEII
jgi:hypothetical protein